ncbi:MAG: hypothetical protein CVU04_00865 [Bacteroidetes bacterium HGW-Bacteroidetes-20]|nr:MAG: hypothetical protein CVU04_00865 [Bacteroidetes bacterium HGW-Bacteroidetes-20]
MVGKIRLLFIFGIFIYGCSPNKVKTELNSEQFDTIIFCENILNQITEKTILLKKDSTINYIDILNSFKDTSNTGPFFVAQFSIGSKEKINDSLEMIKFFNFNQDYVIFIHKKIGTFLIIRTDVIFKNENYLIFHSKYKTQQ